MGNTFIELIQFENYMRGNIMKKIMVLSLIAVCAITDVYAKGKMAVIADTLPQIKKDIAGKLEKCLLSPEQGSGNDYVNVCYGEAADGFLHVGNRYVNLSLARADNQLLKEEIRKDQLFLKQQIQQCDENCNVRRHMQNIFIDLLMLKLRRIKNIRNLGMFL